MGMYLTIAGRNLLQGRRRTLLLGAALGMVTMLLVVLLSLSAGIAEEMISSATTFSAGHINVAGFYKLSSSDTGPMVTDAAKLRKFVEENTPDLDYVIDRQRGWARLVSDASSIQVGLSGIDIGEESKFIEAVQLAKEADYLEGGRQEILGDVRQLAGRDNVMIFAKQADRLGVVVGDALTVTIETFSGRTNTAELTVVAVAKDMGMMSSWNIFMSKETVIDLYKIQEDTAGAIMVYLKDITKAEQVMGELGTKLEAAGYRVMEHDPQPFWMKFDRVLAEDWVGQKIDLTTWRDEVNFLTWVLTAIDGISFFLIGILLMIIAIGIMNAMWISVRERTNEVGTVRAIGMSKMRVLTMFMTEAILLGLVATTIGAVLGAVVAMTVDALEIVVPVEAVQAILLSETLNLSVQPQQLIGAVIGFTIITAISAIWPAYRASQLQPVTAIHHIG